MGGGSAVFAERPVGLVLRALPLGGIAAARAGQRAGPGRAAELARQADQSTGAPVAP